jgi:flavin reductase (DIM6/NTAB) family NADH-FMN oxidoreductase RutF
MPICNVSTKYLRLGAMAPDFGPARTSTEPPEPPAPTDGRQLRRAMGCFATGVAVITSLDAAGEAVGTTANAISSLSLDPPLVLVCFARESETLNAIAHHRSFAINILSTGHQELSTAFARRGTDPNVWEGASHRRGRRGAPRLNDAVASVECELEQRMPGGDHEIVIGRVLDVEYDEADPRPLLFYRGEYASLER